MTIAPCNGIARVKGAQTTILIARTQGEGSAPVPNKIKPFCGGLVKMIFHFIPGNYCFSNIAKLSWPFHSSSLGNNDRPLI